MADTTFVSLLPPALARDERFAALEKIHAQRLQSQDLSFMIPRLIDTVPAIILPLLAEEFGVINSAAWRTAYTVPAQRMVIKNGIQMRKFAGTAWAVEQALKLLQIEPLIFEWFQTNGPRGTFRVEGNVFERAIDADLYKDALAVINQTKNVRSHLSSLQLNVATRSTPLCVGAATIVGRVISVFPKGN